MPGPIAPPLVDHSKAIAIARDRMRMQQERALATLQMRSKLLEAQQNREDKMLEVARGLVTEGFTQRAAIRAARGDFSGLEAETQARQQVENAADAGYQLDAGGSVVPTSDAIQAVMMNTPAFRNDKSRPDYLAALGRGLALKRAQLGQTAADETRDDVRELEKHRIKDEQGAARRAPWGQAYLPNGQQVLVRTQAQGDALTRSGAIVTPFSGMQTIMQGLPRAAQARPEGLEFTMERLGAPRLYATVGTDRQNKIDAAQAELPAELDRILQLEDRVLNAEPNTFGPQGWWQEKADSFVLLARSLPMFADADFAQLSKNDMRKLLKRSEDRATFNRQSAEYLHKLYGGALTASEIQRASGWWLAAITHPERLQSRLHDIADLTLVGVARFGVGQWMGPEGVPDPGKLPTKKVVSYAKQMFNGLHKAQMAANASDAEADAYAVERLAEMYGMTEGHVRRLLSMDEMGRSPQRMKAQ